jgi:hypothetical protein
VRKPLCEHQLLQNRSFASWFWLLLLLLLLSTQNAADCAGSLCFEFPRPLMTLNSQEVSCLGRYRDGNLSAAGTVASDGGSQPRASEALVCDCLGVG